MHWTDPRAWPGKGRPLPGAATPWHPAAFHMLDVAACAEELLRPRAARIAAGTGIGVDNADRLSRSLVSMVTLHDLGKFSWGFLDRIGGPVPDGLSRPASFLRLPHWQATAVLLGHHDGVLEPAIGGSKQARRALCDTIAGHHGQPPRDIGGGSPHRLRTLRAEPGAKAAGAFVRAVVDLIGPEPLPDLDLDQAKALSWHLAGLTTLADWLGSNQAWFPYAPCDVPLDAYWSQARERAARALREAGAVGARPQPLSAPEHWLGLRALRPMQRAARAAPLPDGPVLVMMEDATGSGKTEAALILAQRLIAAGRAGGLYTALPTMATANAMFDRFGKVARRLFETPPSLALAHGRRALHEGFRAAVRADSSEPPPDAATCAGWIADDRRKTFVAEIGVGTIDQALLAVLPVRFGSLRLWGLADKVLIVDEAHAYDRYMTEELKALLRFQARMGGSAIVMSATLPAALRTDLVKAFHEGLRCRSNSADDPSDGHEPSDYPLLTVSGGDERVYAQPVPPTPHTIRQVPVLRVESEAEGLQQVIEAARAGAAVAWVRNAVDDAIAAARQLDGEGLPVDLFHARFAVTDRLRIERKVVARFGPEGSTEDRRGRVLVATQVVEQSLDLDFDVMVSDLAPVDLLIQRAGRLWRHMERSPADTRPGPDCRLVVLMPDPDDVVDDQWLHGALGAGAFVYDQAIQWRTARVIADAGCIDAPDGLRDLIERVYDPSMSVPAPLERIAQDAAGKGQGDAAHARFNLLDVGNGYTGSSAPYDDALYPTRLGEELQTLTLARRTLDGVVPWADEAGDDVDRNWALSEVSLRLRRFQAIEPALPPDDPAITAAQATWPDWRRRSVRMVVVAPDGSIAPALHYDSRWGLVLG